MKSVSILITLWSVSKIEMPERLAKTGVCFTMNERITSPPKNRQDVYSFRLWGGELASAVERSTRMSIWRWISTTRIRIK